MSIIVDIWISLYGKSLGALAQESRLNAFRLLVRSGPDGLAAGEIARQLSIPHNTLSSHLSILSNAGLITIASRKPLDYLSHQF